MSKLHEITAQRRLDVAAAKIAVPVDQLIAQGQSLVKAMGPPLSLLDALQHPPPVHRLGGASKLHVAAEFKRASPSKGNMAAEDLSITEQVETYISSGASVVSVLTEPKWFKGSLQDLRAARDKANELAQRHSDYSRTLILRKDFIVDEYQVHEALAFGADTLLLIVACLTDDELKHLIAFSRNLGMEPLVEAANEAEMTRALQSGAMVIGINNRDLTTFTLDLTTTNRCAAMVPASSQVLVMALSGMKSREDVVPYESFDCIRGVLVGEALMRTTDPAGEIRRLVVDVAPAKKTTLAKICGIVRPGDAVEACKHGANFIGIIFAEKSPRKVSLEEAQAVSRAVVSFRENVKIVLPTSAKKAKPSGLVVLQHACARGPLLVGVFQDQPVDYVNSMVEQVKLDLVQLHGHESQEYMDQVKVPVIKVVHVPVDATSMDVKATVDSCSSAIAILLDTTLGAGKTSGGTGAKFAWNLAKPFVDHGVAVFVAGGLGPENCAEAIQQAGHPFALDCSSGVQPSSDKPREKSPEMIASFLKHVKSAL